MGLKFLYYIDTSANWTLFTLGIICVPFGIGGMLLTTPIRQSNVYAPWYHATGIWVGMVFLCIAMMMPFARFNPTFLRLAVLITFLAMVVSAVGLGVGIDEFTNWFENPTVKTFGTDAVSSESDVYVSQSAKLVVNNFKDFDLFHKIRVIVVMAGTLLGICMLLFRIVTLGLVIFDEFTTRGYDVFTPEEEMMYQAMAEREMGGGDDEKADYEAGYQPILYAGAKKSPDVADMFVFKEDEGDEDESYESKIKGFKDLAEGYKEKSIYDPNALVTTKEKRIIKSSPTYTDAEGRTLIKKHKSSIKTIPKAEYVLFEKEKFETEKLIVPPSKEEKSDDEGIPEVTEETPLLKK